MVDGGREERFVSTFFKGVRFLVYSSTHRDAQDFLSTSCSASVPAAEVENHCCLLLMAMFVQFVVKWMSVCVSLGEFCRNKYHPVVCVCVLFRFVYLFIFIYFFFTVLRHGN